MKRSQFYWWLIGVLAVSGVPQGISAAWPAKVSGGKTTYERDVLPLVKNYCFDCHGDGMKKGDLALDAYPTLASVRADRKIWEHVLQNLKSGQMPPSKKKNQPTLAERDRMVRWIE